MAVEAFPERYRKREDHQLRRAAQGTDDTYIPERRVEERFEEAYWAKRWSHAGSLTFPVYQGGKFTPQSGLDLAFVFNPSFAFSYLAVLAAKETLEISISKPKER